MLGINQNITQKSETTRNIQRKAGEKRGRGERNGRVGEK